MKAPTAYKQRVELRSRLARIERAIANERRCIRLLRQERYRRMVMAESSASASCATSAVNSRLGAC